MKKYLSLFQIEGASRKQIFERGILLALLPPLPFTVLVTVENLSRFLPSGSRVITFTILSGHSSAGGAIWMLNGLVGIVAESLAIRNLKKTIQGLNPMSFASAVMIPVALLLFLMAAVAALLGYSEMMYPGQRIVS